jgi:hypothetical protein
MSRGLKLWSLCLAGLALSACAQEEYPLALWMAQHPDASVGAASEGGSDLLSSRGPAQCRQANAQSYPSRLAAIGAGAASDAGAEGGEAGPAGMLYFEADLYQRFSSGGVCGRCHGAVGGAGASYFQVTSQQQFHDIFGPSQLAHVMSDGPTPGDPPNDPNDANDPMPPFDDPSVGEPYSQRDPNDPIKEFAELAQAWLMANKSDPFMASIGSTQSTNAGTSAVAATSIPIPNAAIGNAMTNIGNCIPTPGLVGIEQTTSAALDAKFAAAQPKPQGAGVSGVDIIGLPEHLRDTDLFTLDSAVLAQYGVIAFAPGYPLWSDNAAKLRFIRVPRGTSVHFDKASQTWTIPPNTRFYKTFMKPIVDVDGSERYKKVETRLILARPDKVNVDGSHTPTALFGTYQWNDDESDAVLVTTPLNDGSPFGDTVLQYTTDEPLAADILKGAPPDPLEALLEAQAARHYAIPSSMRCMQCHEGSATGTFSLGFLPLQINRKPTGTSGVIEAAGPDELTQLQRFIDYGLITGMDSPDDVLPLEQSEGTRSPRNDYELKAQGYLLGNCSHCHNPNGYPSILAPVLVDKLNFLPGPSSGIFQFPLDRMSPRIFRGATGQTQIPYITPSLMDMPRADLTGVQITDPFVNIGTGGYIYKAAFAPWRSLIFRNTENPFAYTDDLALYPHMPMNTPGYDPRVKQIVSDWMVSIPAVRKSPDISEYAFVVDNTDIAFGAPAVDANPQPYVEVFPGDPRYNEAVAASQQRLTLLHCGVGPTAAPDAGADAGSDCTKSVAAIVPIGPETQAYSLYADEDTSETNDILDPSVLANPVCQPVPIPNTNSALPSPVTDIPDHVHWVITDPTQPPGAYSPRRPDWVSTLAVDKPAITPATCGAAAASVAAAQLDQTNAVTELQSIPLLSSVKQFLTTPVPFGLWQVKPGCNFSSVHPVSYYASNPPLWMKLQPNLPPDAPVYEQSRGQAIFKMICINCHGPLADSTGRLAANLATMTGGLAQVADFRDGLFGPVGASVGMRNMDLAFGSAAAAAGGIPSSSPWLAPGVTPDDRASRYMAWMALGGTEVRIPDAILQIVSLTQVLDQPRLAAQAGQHISANMLSTAKGLCESLMACRPALGDRCGFSPDNPVGYSNTLIHTNGDAELWRDLCTLNNPPPIHFIDAPTTPGVNRGFDPNTEAYIAGTGTLLSRSAYPPTAPVGGNTAMTLAADNVWPWCEYDPTKPGPACPPGINTAANEFSTTDEEAWIVRGAINAGLAVFLYVESLEAMNSPPPDYDQCEQLP